MSRNTQLWSTPGSTGVVPSYARQEMSEDILVKHVRAVIAD
jgi:hypothetical protein